MLLQAHTHTHSAKVPASDEDSKQRLTSVAHVYVNGWWPVRPRGQGRRRTVRAHTTTLVCSSCISLRSSRPSTVDTTRHRRRTWPRTDATTVGTCAGSTVMNSSRLWLATCADEGMHTAAVSRAAPATARCAGGEPHQCVVVYTLDAKRRVAVQRLRAARRHNYVLRRVPCAHARYVGHPGGSSCTRRKRNSPRSNSMSTKLLPTRPHPSSPIVKRGRCTTHGGTAREFRGKGRGVRATQQHVMPTARHTRPTRIPHLGLRRQRLRGLGDVLRVEEALQHECLLEPLAPAVDLNAAFLQRGQACQLQVTQHLVRRRRASQLLRHGDRGRRLRRPRTASTQMQPGSGAAPRSRLGAGERPCGNLVHALTDPCTTSHVNTRTYRTCIALGCAYGL